MLTQIIPSAAHGKGVRSRVKLGKRGSKPQVGGGVRQGCRLIPADEKPKTGRGARTTKSDGPGTMETVQTAPGRFRTHRKGGSTMKTSYTALMVVNRAKWMLMGLVLAVVLLFPYQGAMAGQAPVELGSAGNFGVLAGTTVTSTNGGTIKGDVGIWTGTEFVVGDPPVIVTGTLHLGDSTAARAQGDLTTAFNDAAGRTIDSILVSDGELGGKTLTPGLYKSAPGSFAITSVDLTLDAEGNPNAVWIFQMPSSKLTVGNGRQVILAGGAQARNIFWQVGSSATLGTTSAFKGNILAYASITVQTSATLDGSALAQTAAVTLDGNTLTRQPLHSDQPWRILLWD